MKRRDAPELRVTDEALVQYLRCVWGVDVGLLKARIAAESQIAADYGASAVNRGGTRYFVREGRVVKVLRTKRPVPRIRK